MNQAPFDYLHHTITLTDSSGTPLALQLGLATRLYAQYRDDLNNQGAATKMPQQKRLLLTGLSGDKQEKAIVTLDMELARDGRLAHLPYTIPFEKNDSALKSLNNADSDGLSLYGAMLDRDEAKSKSVPWVLESADDQLHVYFQGKNNKFLCAQLDPKVKPANYSVNIEQGVLKFTAKQPGSAMNHAEIGIQASTAGTAVVQLAKDMRPGKGAPNPMVLKQMMEGALKDVQGDAIDFNQQWLACGQGSQSKVLIFRRLAGTWQYQKTLEVEGGKTFGKTLIFNRDVLIIGDPGQDKVYLYQINELEKAPIVLAPKDLQQPEGFGSALSSEKDFLAIGAPKGHCLTAMIQDPAVFKLLNVTKVESPSALIENKDGELKTALDFKGKKGSYAFWPLQANEVDADGLSFDKELTIEFWARYRGSKEDKATLLIAKNNSDQVVLRIHFPLSRHIYFDAGTPYDRINKEADDDFFQGNWIHWAFVKNVVTGQMTIYKGGKEWLSGTGKEKELGTIDRFFLGSSENSRYFWPGAMDCIRIWNRALSAKEILENQYVVTPKSKEGLLLSSPKPASSAPIYQVVEHAHGETEDEEQLKLFDVAYIASPAVVVENQHGDLKTALDLKGKKDSYAFWPPQTDEMDAAGLSFDKEITLEFWARFQGKGNTTVFIAKDNSNRVVLKIHLPYAGNIHFLAGVPNDSIKKRADDDFFQSNWIHWAFVKNADTGQMAIYKNGEEWLIAKNKRKALGTIDRFFLGSSENSRYFWQGSLDCIRIWNRALSAEEIAENHLRAYPENKEGLFFTHPKEDESKPHSGTGCVYIYNLSDQKQLQVLGGSEHKDFGSSLALQGGHLLIGAPGDETTSGATYAYFKKMKSLDKPWEISSTLTLPWPSGEMQKENLQFGAAVAVRGSHALIGCPGLNKAFSYSQDEKGWTFQDSLLPKGQAAVESFGDRVALSGNGTPSGSSARAEMALVASSQADQAFVYYKESDNWGQQYQLSGGKAVAIKGGAIALASAKTLSYYTLARTAERWLHVPRQIEDFVAILNGAASNDPNDDEVRKGKKQLYDYQDKYFVYSLPIVEAEGEPATAHLRLTTRSIKGGTNELDTDHHSVIDAGSGAKITATLENDAVTLTIELPKVYQSVKTGEQENMLMVNALKETWPNLPKEPTKIAAILNGQDKEYNYSDVETTDETVPDLSQGSELVTAIIEGKTNKGQIQYNKLAVPTPQGVIPPRSGLPYASQLFRLSADGIDDKTLTVPEVPTKDTFSVEHKVAGQDATWREEPKNYELSLTADENINVPLDEELNLTGNLSMEAWIRPKTKALDEMEGNLFEYCQPKQTDYQFGLDKGHLVAYHKVQQQVKAAKTLGTLPKPNKNEMTAPWAHVAAVYESSYALNFDSSLEQPLHLDCGDSEDFNLDTGITLEAWVKTPKGTNKATGTIVSKWGDQDEHWQLSIDGSQQAVFTFNTEAGKFEVKNDKALSQPDTLYYLSAFMDSKEYEISPLKFDGATAIEAGFTKQARLSAINLPNSIDAWPKDYTLEFWVYMEEAKDAKLVAFRDESDAQLSIVAKKLQGVANPKLFLETDEYLETDLCLEPGKWNHLAITKGTLYQYVEDDEERAIQKFVLETPLTLQFNGIIDISIGRDDEDADDLQGQIAELRLWNIEREADAIKSSRYDSNITEHLVYKLISNRDHTLITDKDLGPQTKERIGPFAIKNSFALDFWAKRSDTSRDEWVLAQKDEDNYDLHIGFKGKQLAFGWDGTPSKDPKNIKAFSSYESDDQWHHYLIRCTKNTTTTPAKYDVILYVDGEQQEALQFDTIHNNGGPLFIGRGIAPTQETYFQGHLYNIHFWDTALELGQIYQHRFATLDSKMSGLAFSLPLQDGGKVAKNLAGRGGSFPIQPKDEDPSYESFKIGLFDAQLTVLDLDSTADDKLKVVSSKEFKTAVNNEAKRQKCVLTSSDNPVNIGRLSYSAADADRQSFLGLIAEVRIWGEGIQNQPLEYYREKRLEGDEMLLVADWQLNEGRGKVGHDVAHGNDGCLKAPEDLISKVWLPFPDARYAQWHFFLNGQPMPKDPKASVNYQPSTHPSFSLAKGFSGSVGEFRLWKTTRTPAQVADNRYRPLSGKGDALVGYWPCNEAEGTIVKDHSPQRNDASLSSTTIERIGEGSKKIAAPIGTELPMVRNILGGEPKAAHEATALLNTPAVAEYREQQIDSEGNFVEVQKRCYVYPLQKRCGGGRDKLAVMDNFKVNDVTK